MSNAVPSDIADKAADSNNPPPPPPPNRRDRRAAASIARRKTKPRGDSRSWVSGQARKVLTGEHER